VQKYRDLTCIWVDAHPDIHTYSSSASGNTHGTPLSVATGLEKHHWASRMTLKLLPFEKLIYVGIRDIDDWEREIIDKHNIRHFTVQQVVDWVRENDDPIHVSFDVDALDPSHVSSTGTKVDDGLHPYEVEEIIASTLANDQLVSLDVGEFNGQLGDPDHSIKSVAKVFEKCIPEDEREKGVFGNYS